MFPKLATRFVRNLGARDLGDMMSFIPTTSDAVAIHHPSAKDKIQMFRVLRSRLSLIPWPLLTVCMEGGLQEVCAAIYRSCQDDSSTISVPVTGDFEIESNEPGFSVVVLE
jgi:hypothetical protein